MERIRIICLVFFTFIFVSCGALFANEPISMSTLVTPQNVSFETCNKLFNIPAEKLFYLSISGINANRFQIDEIQSKTGYILFTAVNKQFLASIVKIDNTKSVLKITPTNNLYYFPPGIVLNIFKYIEVNENTPVTPVPQKS